jgi:SAM-dependent methyltransferase
MAEQFKDHFSDVAKSYKDFRPNYPAELFAWLAGIAPARRAALDAGCGNGQAAVALAAHFEAVRAVDPGAEQIRHAVPHPRVEYRVAPAEETGLPAGQIDLAVAAQALHWFDVERFYRELRRLARPGAVFAACTYGLTRVNPEVDRLVDDLYERTLRGYWPPERAHVDAAYRTLPFPFPEIDPPAFAMAARWTLAEFQGYLGTWSGLREHRKRTGEDALAALAPALGAAWGAAGEEGRRTVTWPLALRVGRIEPAAGR